MKPDFDRAQDTATALLVQQDLRSLYIDVRDFCLPPNVIIDSMQNFCKCTGRPLSDFNTQNLDGACTIKRDGKNLILYDDDISYEPRKHWGIVHELGHVYLGHTNDDRNSEIEAHFFAAQVVTPEIVLINMARRKGNQLSLHDLTKYFNVASESAVKRISCLNRKYSYSYGENDELLETHFSSILEKELQSSTLVS